MVNATIKECIDEGYDEHDLVQYIYSLMILRHDLNSEKDTGDLLDEYFPVIKDDSFYKKY